MVLIKPVRHNVLKGGESPPPLSSIWNRMWEIHCERQRRQQKTESFSLGKGGAFVTICPLYLSTMFFNHQKKEASKLLARKKKGMSHTAQKMHSRHKPAQAGTKRHKTAQSFVPQDSFICLARGEAHLLPLLSRRHLYLDAPLSGLLSSWL